MKNPGVANGVVVTHFRVVAAMISREMITRFGNNPGGYLWALLDPIANIAFLTLIFSAVAHTPALGTSFPMFFATGFLAFNYYRLMETYISAAIKSNKALLSYPNVAPIDTIVARFILQLVTTSAIAFAVVGFLQLTVRTPNTINYMPIIEAVFAASILGLGTGLGNNVLFEKYPVYERIYTVLSRPLYLISGVFFLPDMIPHPFREFVLINPVIHIVMLFRKGFYPEYRAIGLDMGYLYGWVGIAFFIGLLLFTTNSATLRN